MFTAVDANAFRPHQHLSDVEVLRRLAVYTAMSSPVFGFASNLLKWVAHADQMPQENASEIHRVFAKVSSVARGALRPLAELTLEHTAIPIFFGGVGTEETEKNVWRQLQRGKGAILDYAAPEGVEAESPEAHAESIQAVKAQYLATVAAAQRLHAWAEYKDLPSSDVAMAIKISTLSSRAELEQLSQMLGSDVQGQLTPEGQGILERIQGDVNAICAAAKEGGVRVFIDAEESYLNPAIYKVTRGVLEAGLPVAATLQAYFSDQAAIRDMFTAWAKEFNGLLSVKLVRGAYIEDAREEEKIWNSGRGADGKVIFDAASKRLTDQAYDGSFQEMFASQAFAAITVATQNAQSMAAAARLVASQPENPTKVAFAKLKGIDAVRVPQVGIPVSDYVPYIAVPKDKLGVSAYFGRRWTEFNTPGAPGQPSRGQSELRAVVDEIGYRVEEELRFVAKEIERHARRLLPHGPAKG